MEIFSWAAQGRIALGSAPTGSFTTPAGLYTVSTTDMSSTSAYNMNNLHISIAPSSTWILLGGRRHTARRACLGFTGATQCHGQYRQPTFSLKNNDAKGPIP